MTNSVIIMRCMDTHPVITLLSRWPDRRSVHTDAATYNPELDIVAVHRWFARQSVPSQYWLGLIEGAKRRGIPASADDFAIAHSPYQETPNKHTAPDTEARNAR